MLRGFLPSALLVAATLAGAVDGAAGQEVAGTASAPTRATGSLPFFYDLYTFRGDAGTTRVIAAFAVPAERLEDESVNSGVRYRFDVSLVLADTALHSVSRTDDSVFVTVPRSLDGDHLLHTFVEVDADPSSTTLQRVLMFDATTPGVGQFYGGPFSIRDYRGERLMLSDIALGLPEARQGWTRKGVTLALLPTSQFPQSSFDVYYEIYNLPRGHPYATELSVERVPDPRDEEKGEERTVHTRFTDESRAGDDDSISELRRVVASLDEGRYRLTVTVTDQTTGRTARRTQLFEVRGWGPGITMVPAFPSARESPPAS